MCPECGKGSEVIDSRPHGATIRRRRRCLNEHRFTTTELVGDPKALAAALELLRKALP